MRSAKAMRAATKHKKRPPSALRPDSRRTRNADPRGLEFMAWVRGLPCCVCYRSVWSALRVEEYNWTLALQVGPTEFAHISGNAAAKAPNRHGIPLCHEHHDSGNPHCEHKLKKRFGPHWGIDIEALIQKLNEEFDRLYPPGTKGLLEEGLDGG